MNQTQANAEYLRVIGQLFVDPEVIRAYAQVALSLRGPIVGRGDVLGRIALLMAILQKRTVEVALGREVEDVRTPEQIAEDGARMVAAIAREERSDIQIMRDAKEPGVLRLRTPNGNRLVVDFNERQIP